MPTEVVITSPFPNSQDIIVEIVDLKTGKTLSEARVTEGNHARFWVDDGQSMHVSRVPRKS